MPEKINLLKEKSLFLLTVTELCFDRVVLGSMVRQWGAHRSGEHMVDSRDAHVQIAEAKK